MYISFCFPFFPIFYLFSILLSSHRKMFQNKSHLLGAVKIIIYGTKKTQSFCNVFFLILPYFVWKYKCKCIFEKYKCTRWCKKYIFHTAEVICRHETLQRITRNKCIIFQIVEKKEKTYSTKLNNKRLHFLLRHFVALICCKFFLCILLLLS